MIYTLKFKNRELEKCALRVTLERVFGKDAYFTRTDYRGTYQVTSPQEPVLSDLGRRLMTVSKGAM